MLRIALLSLAILATASCGGDDETPAGKYGEQCGGDDCAEGLTCVRAGGSAGVCTFSCASAADCRTVSPVGVCSGGNCYDSCTDSFQCKGGNVCVMFGVSDGTCRPQ